MTNTTQSTNRWDEIRGVHRRFAGFYELLGGGVLVTILLVIGAYIFIDQMTDFSMNAFTEAIGVVGTALILDRLNRQRSQQEKKEEMIFQMGSSEPITAKSAARMLRHRGWLKDGSLRKAALQHADLQGTDFHEADFAGVNLSRANLSDANLSKAYLEGAILANINLEDAYLIGANMTDTALTGARLEDAKLSNVNLAGSDLTGSNLKDTDLSAANLSGASLRATIFTNANLYGAQLTGADLYRANFKDADLREATLPDGTQWTYDTDMTRFTDPNHSSFWQPDNVEDDKS